MQALSQLSYTPNEAAHSIDAFRACKAFASISIRKKFSGVEQAERIELLLDRAHQIQRGGIDFTGDEAALFGADAVFAREGAAQRQGLQDDGVERKVGALHLIGVIRVHHEIDVQIAVAGVAE